MSDSLRDMYVGIQFDDGASKAIDRIDGKMDELERGFIKFDTKVDKSGTGLQAMGKVGMNATNQLATGFNKSERELNGFSDEVDDSHKGLRKVGSEGDKATDELERGFKKSEKEAKGFNREAKNSSDALGGIKRAAMGLGGIIAGAFAVDKIKDFATSGIENAASVQALNSQFDQVYGDVKDSATTSLNDIAKETGVLPERLKGSFVQMAAFAKTTGVDTADALKLTERATLAAADSAAFYDRSIEDVTDNLQSLLKGNFENDAALGISVTETTRNAKANELYGKSFKDLSEAQKQLTLLQMVEDGNKAAGAIGQAAREADGYENVIGNFKSSWETLKGTMMAPFLDTVTGGLEKLTAKLQGIDAEQIGMKMKSGFDSVMDVAIPTFNALKDGLGWLIDNKDTIISVGAGLAAGFIAFKAINIGKSIFGAVKAIGSIGLMANPVGIAVVAIGALVAAGVYLYKNWDKVKEKAGILKDNLSNAWQQIKDNVSEKVSQVTGFFGNLKDGIVNTWDGIRDNVGNAVSQVGGFITGLKDKAIGLWETIKQNPMLLSVVGPIGAVIGAGITLYQNWDTVKAKAGELWATTKEKFAGMKQSASDFVNPAIQWFGNLNQTWESVKTKANELWSTSVEKFAGIKQSVSDFIQPAISWFDNLTGKWNDFKSAIANFKMPEWVTTAGSMVSNAVGKVKGLMDGSHATGLASVPFDGYRAELHKGETVLTANQSDTLRSVGALSANSDGTPNLNFDKLTKTPSLYENTTNNKHSVLNRILNRNISNNQSFSEISQTENNYDNRSTNSISNLFNRVKESSFVKNVAKTLNNERTNNIDRADNSSSAFSTENTIDNHIEKSNSSAFNRISESYSTQNFNRSKAANNIINKHAENTIDNSDSSVTNGANDLSYDYSDKNIYESERNRNSVVVHSNPKIEININGSSENIPLKVQKAAEKAAKKAWKDMWASMNRVMPPTLEL